MLVFTFDRAKMGQIYGYLGTAQMSPNRSSKNPQTSCMDRTGFCLHSSLRSSITTESCPVTVRTGLSSFLRQSCMGEGFPLPRPHPTTSKNTPHSPPPFLRSSGRSDYEWGVLRGMTPPEPPLMNGRYAPSCPFGTSTFGGAVFVRLVACWSPPGPPS